MTRQPNILWYCTDQQRWDTIRALGQSQIETPTLDWLCANGVAFGNNRVNGIYGRVLYRTGAAARDERTLFAHEFRLDKQVAECRMRGIGAHRRQNDFSVARQLDFTHAG